MGNISSKRKRVASNDWWPSRNTTSVIPKGLVMVVPISELNVVDDIE